MAYLLLADGVVILHVGFVLFTALGGLLLLRNRSWMWIQTPAFVWAGFIELTGGVCPLTPLENHLRTLGGGQTYQGDFIGRYLLAVLYPESLTREVQIILGLLVVFLNAGFYTWFFWLRPKHRGERT